MSVTWEEIAPLFAYAPEDDEGQAVVAMRDLLRYSDNAPPADLRAAEVAREYRLHCRKAAYQFNYLFYLEGVAWGRFGCGVRRCR